ncbi:hypothetical protein D6789_02275 [Candidatus Woesearchaeota archaeon]|nr:MAG: hypothetical protein D6789_02275 [Candidatus Woesearchaeota archaeon]
MVQAVLERRQETNKQIFDILFNTDEVSWKQIIFGLIDQEQMDPWDIDISLMAQKFLQMLKQLKEMDFRITGKIVLASAILLKMKSKKLVDEEIAALDQLINSADEPVDLGLFEDFPIDGLTEFQSGSKGDKPTLVPRTPQPRKRKVSVYDLVEALEKALEVDAKRIRRPAKMLTQATVPDNPLDLAAILQDIYTKVNKHYKKKAAPVLTFDALCPSDAREDKVLTFIPLLHLDFQRKIDVAQEQHFGVINVHLLKADASFTQAELEAQ